MSIRDVNETGHFDSTKLDNSAMGIIRKTTINPQQLNYSQFNASISYRINKATFTLGQGQQTIGYGKMGNIVLSDKAPSYPFFKIIYTPTRWLKFNYMHAWLQSGIVDSTKTYGLGNTVYGGKREIYVPKFFATHFVEIIPMRGLSINLGESIVYTDQLEVPYLIPISFFKAFDNNKFGDNILAGANGQIFMGISSRNQLPKTHLYAQLFVDEIRVSSAFISSKSRNQLGYQLGASVTDVILPTLTFSAEYTRINPFVYRNFIPAQNYTSSKYYLGDWMGANADRLFFSAQYKPKAKALVKAFYMLMGKGGQGTIEDQYFAQPQPIFGFDPKYKRTQFGLEAYYELFNNIQCRFSHIITTQKPYLQGSTEQTTTSLGFIWSRL